MELGSFRAATALLAFLGLATLALERRKAASGDPDATTQRAGREREQREWHREASLRGGGEENSLLSLSALTLT